MHMRSFGRVSQEKGFTLTRTSESRGFTLIELLVVIAIIGILSSVTLASLNSSRGKARDARRLQDVKQIQTALELYIDDNNGEYPDDIYSAADGLALSGGKTYLDPVPQDPRASNYLYANLNATSGSCSKATGFCTSYVLGAWMEGDVPNDVDGSLVGGAGDGVVCTDTSPGGNPNNYCIRP